MLTTAADAESELRAGHVPARSERDDDRPRIKVAEVVSEKRRRVWRVADDIYIMP